jgi:hypothetical protein
LYFLRAYQRTPVDLSNAIPETNSKSVSVGSLVLGWMLQDKKNALRKGYLEKGAIEAGKTNLAKKEQRPGIAKRSSVSLEFNHSNGLLVVVKRS